MQTQTRQPDLDTREQRVTLHGISWAQFKGVEANLVDVRSLNLSYLQGILEIMSPISDKHEEIKSNIGKLLEVYMDLKQIRHYRRGGFTLEAEGYTSGTPDESYSIGVRRELPDIVIEVIITSGTIKRTDLYLPLAIPEVWFWRSGKLRVFQWQDSQYQEVATSQFFPDLDLAILLQYVQHPDQYDAVQEFIADIEAS
ncbi:MAG: Uma2 family endonuclease [Cyanobacteria bacterium P01_G01_bin.54]